jgi:manganese/iron transport system substrate-binding protein
VKRRAAALASVAVVVLTGCGGSSRAESDGRLEVAASVAPITDIVRQVVGDRAPVIGLIPDGVDSHTFEPTPSTVRKLAAADILFVDGLHLEDGIVREARRVMAGGSTIVALGDRTIPRNQYQFDATFPREKGDPNPHLWMDPQHALRWSEIVRDTVAERDAKHAATYRANQARFATAVTMLHAAITTATATVPAAHRTLLTYHDSFAYFATRYGYSVIGAVQPSDFSEPSAHEVRALIAQIRATGVPAVFGSEVFPSKVLAEIAAEAHARYVASLRDDTLPGRQSDARHTYLGMMVDDVSTIVRALGGDPSALATVPVAATWR